MVFIRWFVVLLPIFGLVGCGKSCSNRNDNDEKSLIKVGVLGGPEEELWQKVKEIALKEQNLKIELVIFSDYMTPNIALNDGSIDANAFQHFPFLEKMIQDRGLKITTLGKTFIFPMAIYSSKYSDLAKIPKGAKVGIPNDPTNGGRALLLLAKSGLITLRNIKNLMPEVTDIVENPKNLKIIQLDAALLPRSLGEMALAVINSNFALLAKLDIETSLLKEDATSYFTNIIAVKNEDVEKEWAKKLLKSFQNSQISEAAKAIFGGVIVPAWGSKEL